MIRMFVMDVDGTLTDGKIHMGAEGELFKSFDSKDGLGIKELLPTYGIVPVVITGRKSEIVLRRMEELGVSHIYQGVSNKLELLHGLTQRCGFLFSEVAYIGDDINDSACMEVCGLSACPSDAVDHVKKTAGYICASNGGNGAVREFIEEIIRSRESSKSPKCYL